MMEKLGNRIGFGSNKLKWYNWQNLWDSRTKNRRPHDSMHVRNSWEKSAQFLPGHTKMLDLTIILEQIGWDGPFLSQVNLSNPLNFVAKPLAFPLCVMTWRWCNRLKNLEHARHMIEPRTCYIRLAAQKKNLGSPVGTADSPALRIGQKNLVETDGSLTLRQWKEICIFRYCWIRYVLPPQWRTCRQIAMTPKTIRSISLIMKTDRSSKLQRNWIWQKRQNTPRIQWKTNNTRQNIIQKIRKRKRHESAVFSWRSLLTQ